MVKSGPCALTGCSCMSLFDHNIPRGAPLAPLSPLDHAGVPGVENLLALSHHALGTAELWVVGDVLGAARSPALATAPVYHAGVGGAPGGAGLRGVGAGVGGVAPPDVAVVTAGAPLLLHLQFGGVGAVAGAGLLLLLLEL